MSTADVNSGVVLLAIARAAIARELGIDALSPEEGPWLLEPGATFVTLRQGERLRGCIGSLEARRALVHDVRANAVGAAFRDPRFQPMHASELEATCVEVSLLSALEIIAFEDERHALAQIRPGVDGVMLQYGYHKSTFLPQVWEELPELDEFMGHLKQKAGLPPDFWEAELKLARYTVSKWSESR
ncbi:MAG: AmmeMemoRadiSam system protein A [Burkholderiales bacterium]